MSETLWLLLGIPIVIWLAVRAVQRVRLLKQRIADVQDEMERNPQSPYQALAELLNPPPPSATPLQEQPRGKRID